MTEDTTAHGRTRRAIQARSPRIALLVERLGNSYSDPIFAELAEAAREQGVGLVCLIGELTAGDLPPTRQHVSHLATPDSVDGVLVLSVGPSLTAEQVTLHCERYRPLPMSSIAVPWKAHPHVLVDNEPGMREGITHLIEVHGYRRIAFVRGPPVSEEAELRFRIYREVLAAHGIPYDPLLVAPGLFLDKSGVEAVRLLLDARKVTIDAIACANDAMAAAVIRELGARGIAVPSDIAVLGFDDSEGSRYLDPPLTTVRQPLAEQAREAFAVLLRQIAEGQRGDARVLKTELVVRQSCGCPSYWPGDAAREEKGAPSEPRPGKSKAATAMNAVLGPSASSAPEMEALSAAFQSDISDGGNSFLPKLHAMLQSLAAVHGDVGSFQKVITVLDRQTVDRLEETSEKWQRADNLLHAARILVSAMAERIPAALKQRYEDFAHKLLRANEAIMTAADMRSLGVALAKHLPTFGIASACICLYEGEGIPAPSSRLILAWDSKGQFHLPEGGLEFPTASFLPPQFLVDGRRSVHVVFPLERDEKSPGYVVFEHAPKEGFAYELLSQQLSAALRRIRLLDQLVEQARLRHAAERERMENEMAVARRIQSGLLPRRPRIEGLELSAIVRRAVDIGGDYYDVIPVKDGCWISMGSVSGRGLPTGLAVLMLQSIVNGITRTDAEERPSAVLPFIQAVLAENIRMRLAHDERADLMLARYHIDGRLTIAGAQSGFLLCRADGRVHTAGWLEGATDLVRKSAPPKLQGPREQAGETAYELRSGDLFILYTKGIHAGPAARGESAGPPRLSAALERARHEPVQVIRDALLEEMEQSVAARRDDVTLLVARHRGSGFRAGGAA